MNDADAPLAPLVERPLLTFAELARLTGDGWRAITAAVVAHAVYDRYLGVVGNPYSDPGAATQWLRTKGARQIALLGALDGKLERHLQLLDRRFAAIGASAAALGTRTTRNEG